MTQSSLLAFAVVGQQAEETREQHQALQRAREERKKQALELLGLPWPEPTRKGAGRPTFEHQYRAAACPTAAKASKEDCVMDAFLMESEGTTVQ